MSRRTTVLLVLGTLVSIAGGLVAWWQLSASRDDAGRSGGGPSSVPSQEPSGPPSGGPSGAPGGDPDGVLRYVALGDSYTAASGVPELTGDARCGRSTHNYPHMLANELSKVELVDVSCTAADTTHLTAGQFPGMAPQLDALTADTDLVTLGMGGNDLGLYTHVLLNCPAVRESDETGAPCSEASGSFSEEQLVPSIKQIGERLETAIDEIGARSPDAQIILVGYPLLVPETGTCPDRYPVADGDFPYVGRIIRLLHTEMEQTAARAGATYVDVYTPSRGHDICSDDPWVNDQTTDPEAILYHPFAQEQAAVARLILAALD